jgi:hypothetical protein
LLSKIGVAIEGALPWVYNSGIMLVLVVGKFYRLNQPTIAIVEDSEGRETAIELPATSIVKLVELESMRNTATVEFDGKNCAVFTVDLQNRCQEFGTLRQALFGRRAP